MDRNTPSTVAAAIRSSINDHTGQAVPHLVEIVPLAIGQGIRHDADAVIVNMVEDGELVTGAVVGCTLLVGTAVQDYLWIYHNQNADQVHETIDRIIADAEESFVEDAIVFFPLRGSDDRWRSFRGERLKDYNVVVGGVERDMN